MWPLMELGHGRQGQTKQRGSETGKYPPCQEEWQHLCTSDAECSHPPEEGPLPPVEGWLYTLHQKWWKMKMNKEARIDSQSTGMCSLINKGDSWRNPLSVTQATGLNSLRIPSPQNSKLQWTVSLTIKDCDRQYHCNTFYLGFYQICNFYKCYLTSNIVNF